MYQLLQMELAVVVPVMESSSEVVLSALGLFFVICLLAMACRQQSIDWDNTTEEEVLEEVLHYLRFRFPPSKIYYKKIMKDRYHDDCVWYDQYTIILKVDIPVTRSSVSYKYPEYDVQVQITVRGRPEFNEFRPKMFIGEMAHIRNPDRVIL